MATNGTFNTSGYDGRYLTFAWTLQSQSSENNTSTITWTLKGAGTAGASWYKAGNFKVVINGATVYSSATRINLYNGTLVASGTYTMTHENNGTKSFTASAEAGIYTVAVNCRGSKSFTLPTISRYAVITSATNFNDSTNPSCQFTNPTGAKLRFTLNVGGSDVITRDNQTNPDSPFVFNLTTAEWNQLRALSPNSNTLAVRYRIGTYINNSIANWSYLDRTMTIANANPTISNASYADVNADSVAVTGNNQIIVQNQSNLQFTFGTLTAIKSASLSSIAVTINSVTKSVNLSGTTQSNVLLSFGLLNVSSDINASIVLTDSRNNKTTTSMSINVEAWQKPTAIISCQRKNNYYSETDLTVNANYASIGGTNSCSITYSYKETSSSSWSSPVSIQSGVETEVTLDNTKEWDVKVVLTDRFDSNTYYLTVDIGIPIVYFDRLKRSMGINCFPENSESLEVNGIDILKAIQYQSGDVQTISSFGVFNGYISNSATQINFSIPLPKSMGNLTPSLEELKINVRTADGGYLFTNSYVSAGYDVLNDSTCTITLSKPMDNLLTIRIDRTTAHDTTNNTTISVMVMSAQISFQ